MNDEEQNDDRAPGRYALKPSVEKTADNYTKIISRVLLGAAAMGVAGKLGQLARVGLLSGDGWTMLLAMVLLLAALGMMVVSVPVFIFAFGAWIGEERFNGPEALKNPYGVVFALGAVLMFVALTHMMVKGV